jgi:hypothetical protein
MKMLLTGALLCLLCGCGSNKGVIEWSREHLRWDVFPRGAVGETNVLASETIE